MTARQWGVLRETGITAVAFLATVGVAWAVCAWIGHPSEGANRWAVCLGFGTVVATAVGTAVHREAARRQTAGATSVLGDRNRVAGAGAHHNDFGDRQQPQPAAPAPSPAPSGDAADPPEAGADVYVRGTGNRVAGPGASHNRFGDGAPDEGAGQQGAGPV
ncbi:MAG TPA: hypothetical protein VFP69_20480 [Streptomyces sp.]|nr:hypothetical protein [Streptomyces sp.]